jgi:hypothetical protein
MNTILTEDIAQALVADPGVNTKAFASITPGAAAILAANYRRTSDLGVWFPGCLRKSCLDLRGLTTLDLPSVTALADWGRERASFLMELNLSGLQCLAPDVASALAGWGPVADFANAGCALLLDGVNGLSAESLAALAQWNPQSFSASLSLGGLKSIDLDQANALASWTHSSQSRLSLTGIDLLHAPEAEALAGFPGYMLALGLSALHPETAAALSRFGGKALSLSNLSQIDIQTARCLFNPEGQNPRAQTVPPWETLQLGTANPRMSGITPKLADWIAGLRAARVAVLLSDLTELSAYANCSASGDAQPRTASIGINGGHGAVHCPFCGQQVASFSGTAAPHADEQFDLQGGADVLVHDSVNPETWDQHWSHSLCPHVVAVTDGHRPVVRIAGVTSSRSTGPKRIHIDVTESGAVLSLKRIFEFAPTVPA